jgi:hypothetical protein
LGFDGVIEAMAIAKCESCGQPTGTKRTYVQTAKPLGYPQSALLCNASDCFNPAVLWLDRDEAGAYSKGERIFSPITGAVKIRVQ